MLHPLRQSSISHYSLLVLQDLQLHPTQRQQSAQSPRLLLWLQLLPPPLPSQAFLDRHLQTLLTSLKLHLS